MTALLFVAAAAAAAAGVWPMALAGVVLGLLVHVGQRTDDAVSGDDDSGAGDAVRALWLLALWAVIGLLGLVVLGAATMAVL